MYQRKYNICIIKPKDYIHSLAFMETAELVHYSLVELNLESSIKFNEIDPDRINIFFGFSLLDEKFINQLPKNSIVFNTEPIYDINVPSRQKIIDFLSNYSIWDYSDQNINFLKSIGIINVKLFQFGFQKELVRIPKNMKQDIDILFYGSLNERRISILNKLNTSGFRVEIANGVFGKERDLLIERSKVILNVYYYNQNTFDIVRFFYLITNSKAIVSEECLENAICKNYNSGIYSVPYDNLVDSCSDLIRIDDKRISLESDAFKTILSIPQIFFTKKLLE
jgi:hypothetical protein